MNNFYIQYPEYFFLIIPFVIFLFILYFRKSKNTNFLPMQDLLTIYKGNSFYYKIHFLLLFVIFSLFLFILSKPYIKEASYVDKRNWIDIEIVFDLSYSMAANDLKPSRLDVAKEVLIEFLKEIENDRVWLILFSGKPFTSIPLSFDYDFIKGFISNLTIDTISKDSNILSWTAIWDGLVLATDYLIKNKDREKVIILIADWDINKWISLELAIKYAKKNNVKIYSIWVWWDEKTYITMKIDLLTIKKEVEKINEETLKQIAEETWWKYFRAKNKNDFKDIFNLISKLEQKEIIINKIGQQKEISYYFVLLLILTLYFYFFLIYLKKFRF